MANPLDTLTNKINSAIQSVTPTQAIDTLPPLPAGPHKINTGIGHLRHFIFVLQDGISGTTTQVELNINPEDFQFDNPFRVNVTQTIGGAFADVWGTGLNQLVLRGHTGWRRQNTNSTKSSQDGFDNLFALRDDIINKYFTLREQASQSNTQLDINAKLKLTIVDKLHEKAYRVIPQTFRLLRNKARPLLLMYEVSFIVLEPNAAQDGPLDKLLTDSDKTKALWDGFDTIQTGFGDLATKNDVIGGPFKDALSDISNVGGGLANTMKQLLNAKQNVEKGMAGVVQTVSNTTRAIHMAMGTIQSYVDFSTLAADAKMIWMEGRSLMRGLECLVNGLKSGGLFTFINVSGASACSTLLSLPRSPLSSTDNSFETIRSGMANTEIQKIQNAISVSAQQSAEKALRTDTPMELLGK